MKRVIGHVGRVIVAHLVAFVVVLALDVHEVLSERLELFPIEELDLLLNDLMKELRHDGCAVNLVAPVCWLVFNGGVLRNILELGDLFNAPSITQLLV